MITSGAERVKAESAPFIGITREVRSRQLVSLTCPCGTAVDHQAPYACFHGGRQLCIRCAKRDHGELCQKFIGCLKEWLEL